MILARLPAKSNKFLVKLLKRSFYSNYYNINPLNASVALI